MNIVETLWGLTLSGELLQRRTMAWRAHEPTPVTRLELELMRIKQNAEWATYGLDPAPPMKPEDPAPLLFGHPVRIVDDELFGACVH